MLRIQQNALNREINGSEEAVMEQGCIINGLYSIVKTQDACNESVNMDSTEARRIKNPDMSKELDFRCLPLSYKKNCISLEKTSKFRHKDLTAAGAQDEPRNQIASLCQNHKGGTRPCPQQRL